MANEQSGAPRHREQEHEILGMVPTLLAAAAPWALNHPTALLFDYRVGQGQGHPGGINWSEDYAQVVSGGILGDGRLTLRKRMVTPTYTETHGIRQRDYVAWKCRILGASSGEYTHFDERTGKFYVHSTLWVTDPRNHGLYNEFYIDGKKMVTAEALSHLGDLALTVLWLDDGSTKLHDGNGKISLQGFLPSENRLIMSWLSGRYGIHSVLTPENEIFISSKEMPKLLSVVYPVYKLYRMPECMRYKMGLMDPKNGELIEKAKEKRRKHDRGYYMRVMNDPDRRAKLRESAYKARQRRLANPEYRRRFNEYHRMYALSRRADPENRRIYNERQRMYARRRMAKVMKDPKRMSELRAMWNEAQRRRMSNPEHRARHNEYQRQYMRNRRARHAK